MAVQTLPIDQPVDHLFNESRNFVLQNLSSAPTSPAPVAGQKYYDTSLHEEGYFNGTAWVYSVTTPDATTSSKGIVQLAGDFESTSTAAVPRINGLHAHAVAARSTVNVSIASPGTAVFDSFTVASGQRIVLLNQTTTSQNGVWVFNGTSSALTRPSDWASGRVMTSGQLVVPYNGGSGVAVGGPVLVLAVSGGGATFVVDTDAVGSVALTASPAGAAGGDLQGTYPNPSLVSHVVDMSRLATSVTLNAIATAGATSADVDLNTHKLINVQDPTAAQHAATKNYVDTTYVSGINWKRPALVATTGAEAFTIASGSVTQITGTTVDGISPAINDRILIKNAPASTGAGSGTASTSSTQPGNGIYVVTNATTNLTVTRDTDATTAAQLLQATLFAEKGSNADALWTMSTDPTITVGTTALTFTNIQSGTSVTGDGTFLVRTANAIGLVAMPGDPTNTTAGTVVVTAAAVTRTVRAIIDGNATLTTFTVTHNLGNRALNVTVQAESAGSPTTPTLRSWAPSSANAITVDFSTAPASGTKYYVTIAG